MCFRKDFLKNTSWQQLLNLECLGAIHKVRTQVGGEGSYDKSIWVSAGLGGFKTDEYVLISTVYFSIFEDFLNKKHK